MLPKPIFGYAKPKFNYELLSTKLPQPVPIAMPASVTLLLPREMGPKPSPNLKPGTRVKTGQLLTWDDQPGPAIVSSVTGTITTINAYLADYGRKYVAITISPETKDEWDEQFSQACDEISLQTMVDFLSSAPGAPELNKLNRSATPIHTIVVYGGDTDLLIDTSLFVLKSRIGDLENGVRILKKATGIEKMVLAVPGESFQNFDGHLPMDVRAVPNTYPYGQPLMIYYQLFDQIIDQGQTFESQGVVFLSAEAVASIGQAVSKTQIPVQKLLTVLDKKGRKQLVSARIGTPIGYILKAMNITLNNRDRLIMGGPMTGTAIYSVDQPILPNTGAIMVQDNQQIIPTSDYPCINCGECIRVCPANVAVNMLVRSLEAGQYQDAADLYDLYSCVECGLCSFTCVSRIPILQYIKLAKFELARLAPVEEENNE